MDRKGWMSECSEHSWLEVACDSRERSKRYVRGTVVSFEYPPPQEYRRADSVGRPYQRDGMNSPCPACHVAGSPMASYVVHEMCAEVNNEVLQSLAGYLQNTGMHVDMDTTSNLILEDRSLPWCSTNQLVLFSGLTWAAHSILTAGLVLWCFVLVARRGIERSGPNRPSLMTVMQRKRTWNSQLDRRKHWQHPIYLRSGKNRPRVPDPRGRLRLRLRLRWSRKLRHSVKTGTLGRTGRHRRQGRLR